MPVLLLPQLLLTSEYAEELSIDNKNQEKNTNSIQSTVDQPALDRGIDYLDLNRDGYGIWYDLDDCTVAIVFSTIENLIAFDDPKDKISDLVNSVVEYYEMLSADGYKYEVRWHTKTPGAPEGQGNTWVVTRTTLGTATGQPKTTHILVDDTWVPRYQWQAAITAFQNGTATPEQLSLLENGHWPAT